MSKKRTSPESSTDKQTNENSDSFQQDENAKRAKLTPLSDTTLQDLPMELIELILIKAVAMEVMGMTRKNSEWKRAAEPVISRLTTVCPQWTSILTTNYFRNELHRTFAAEKTIRLEIVLRFPVPKSVIQAVAFKDELYTVCLVCPDTYYLDVYDRNNVAEVKDVIPLPGIEVEDIAACNVSNCLYLLNNIEHHSSVLRLTKIDEHQFDISPLISDLQRLYDTLEVDANGNLILAWDIHERRAVITVYGPNGQLQHEARLSPDDIVYRYYRYFSKVIPKSNGNFVLTATDERNRTMILREVNVNGTILRQYQSSLESTDVVSQADSHGRIAIVRGLDETELFDSDLNQLEYSGPQLDEGGFNGVNRMHYNSERNEVVTIVNFNAVIILRFIEE